MNPKTSGAKQTKQKRGIRPLPIVVGIIVTAGLVAAAAAAYVVLSPKGDSPSPGKRSHSCPPGYYWGYGGNPSGMSEEEIEEASRCLPENATVKPVLYFYPASTTEMTVTPRFKINDGLIYPAFNDGEGWIFKAQPDGKLSLNDQLYNYLFWEGKTGATYSTKEGNIVPREETVSFFEKALSAYGLTSAEKQDFITYWGNELRQNEANEIYFVNDQYERMHQYDVTPRPDTKITVFMVYRPAKKGDAMSKIQAFPANPPLRTGVTVVEWGGRKL